MVLRKQILSLSERMRRSKSVQVLALLSPSAVYLLVFFLLPLLIVLLVSLGKRGPMGGVVYDWNLDNYIRFIDAIYFKIFIRSIWIATANTLLCLLFGYPFAYFIARRPKRWRNVLILLVMVPFWTNFLVRTYAWMIILRDKGVINSLLVMTGIITKPLPLLFNQNAVILGLFYGYLPFMVLPLYASIEKLDFSLVEAAQDLGANTLTAFRRIVLPLTMPGIVAGAIITFIPSVGAYVTPDILGGAKAMMIGNLLQQQFLEVRDWPFGSAVGFILMVTVLLATMVYFRTGGKTL
ncbi:MAG: ABC transporter permease subunit [Anaerolineae bacterium]|nr:ABC transporter permease subunit [Anaerolineae bacterium]NIN94767.1 ABC transporter permease subunit [Anaerolineae bacterium]NIQ77849.1 ABC transporter permease subunit [Anaerolineae bacterium]